MGSVVVLGSINMDLVVRVAALPAPGETALGDRLLRAHGGKGANQAVAAARLGGTVRIAGRVGDDDFGRELAAGLGADGVDTTGVAVDGAEPSGVALIVVDRGGENQITVAPGANAAVGEPEVAAATSALAADDVLVMQLEIPLPAVLQAIERARAAGARTVLNAAPATTLAGQPVPAVDVLIVNRGEAEALGGVDALQRAVPAVVVTLGDQGVALHEDGRTAQIDALKIHAVDATAAGDAFVGAVAFAMSMGLQLVEAVRLGAAAGAAAATKVGAQPSLPTADDLREMFGIDIARHAK